MRWTIRLLLLLASAAAAVACDGETADPSDECVGNDDCDEGEVCRDRRCIGSDATAPDRPDANDDDIGPVSADAAPPDAAPDDAARRDAVVPDAVSPPDTTVDARPADASCVPAPEICNGEDDDCDGRVDEAFPELGTGCNAGEGACAATGVFVCNDNGDGVTCGAEVGEPIDELCNGEDDDCDGSIDETFLTLGRACTSGEGFCATQGVQVCAEDGSGTTCDAVPGEPRAEQCDGRDDDCDGQIDEDFDTLGHSCTAGEGACVTEGVFVCSRDGSAAECDAEPAAPGRETCDGTDDDCDGQVDEAFPALGSACQGGVGECVTDGVLVCNAAGDALECDAIPTPPVDEACDGLDNNCDGNIDEAFDTLGEVCMVGVGECAAEGLLACTENGDGVVCIAVLGQPVDELCDGLDNDCDGSIDEDFADLGAPCTGGIGACQSDGLYECSEDGLGLICANEEGEIGVERCNGADDDCDGNVDEDFVELGGPCTSGTGECEAEGVFACADDELGLVCNADEPEPQNERCDGLDNDCDGLTDETWQALGALCNVGLGGCQATGVFECTGNQLGIQCSAVPSDPTEETCNFVDDDCDGATDEDFAVGEICQVGVGSCRRDAFSSCNLAGDGTVCIGAAGAPSDETCNGADDDCDGVADEDFGAGEPCTVGIGECATEGVRVCNLAGDDSFCDAASGEPDPGDLCDGLDNNCDGEIDEGFGIGDACTVGVGACTRPGVLACSFLQTTVNCEGERGLPTPEVCNDIDDDCDLSVDETFETKGDPCEVGIGACYRAGVHVCNDTEDGTVCGVEPGEPTSEICNGIDDDCDGLIDEDFPAKGDVCDVGIGACNREGELVCNALGDGLVCGAEPGEPVDEICNLIDDDCDEETDETFPLGDFCLAGLGECQVDGELACDVETGGTTCVGPTPPPIQELCDFLDNDCDGEVDEAFIAIGEPCISGFGVCIAEGITRCTDNGLSVLCDAVIEIEPSEELCNGIDDDCNGLIDNGFFLGDICERREGDCSSFGRTVCAPDGEDVVCDAPAPAVEPEACNGIDDDCDGLTDEDFADLGSLCNAGVGTCNVPGRIRCDTDGSAAVCSAIPLPPQDERCDGLDNDCDGEVDEDFDLGGACLTGVGYCAGEGIWVCAADRISARCTGVAGPPRIREFCNREDDDCDGLVDEDFEGLGEPCANGVSRCREEGEMVCAPNAVDVVCSVEGLLPEGETCDGIDNNCDGNADEGCNFEVSAMSLGKFHSCVLTREDNRVVCWGRDHFGQLLVPDGSFVQLSAGFEFNCALPAGGGDPICWGLDIYDETEPPPAVEFRWVAAGGQHVCGIREQNFGQCWGWDRYDQDVPPPNGGFDIMGSGKHNSCALLLDGTVQCWGRDTYMGERPIEGRFLQLSVGAEHACGIREDTNSIECWGRDFEGQLEAPEGQFIHVSAGAEHSCGVRDNGVGVCWGENEDGQLNVPADLFSELHASKKGHTCGIREDFTISCWGRNEYGQASPPDPGP